MKEEKVICEECNWHGLTIELLHAQNPFDVTEHILGCPNCKTINSLVVACDEPDCWSESSCGTPTLQGYRRTCHKHYPSL